MKNFMVVLGLLASFAVISGCASKQAPEVAPAAAPAHHDVKGEVSSK